MNNNKSKILIVDDEPVNRLILARSFLEDEYAIFESSSGYEALTFIDHEVPDIILLDIMMPGMDGFQVCEKIKNNPKTFDVPILLITALNDKQSKLKGLQLGANDVITKPFDIFEVKLRVKQYLKMRELFLQIKEHNDRMKKEILAARKIQLNMLPQPSQHINNEYFFNYEYYPCEDLGGDFLDFSPISSSQYLFYIADVSGHGVASSLVTVFLKEFFNQYLKKIVINPNPADILQKLNNALLAVNFEDKYMTMFIGILNIVDNIMYWSSAGPNTFPILFNGKNYIELENKAPALGWWADISFNNYSVEFPHGSSLICYSDAAIEIKNQENQQLGRNAFIDILIQNKTYESLDFQQTLHDLLDYGNIINFDDDLTLMGIKRAKASE
ncbi:MAG: response regulator [Candidatus Cloacimonadales bacterium]|jgi:sigma-B regulation protein RsbU (phosphoserine phosphatase)|nr:response regulator [Candidatus Cloacimonadota bacterium]MDX9977710.1 response regulator [Candidatus Cloacimonadales bacterium]